MKLHEGSLKLAGLYLAVLMALSIFFSATLYQTSLHELDRGLHKPTAVINGPIGPGFSEVIRQQIIAEREVQYRETRDHILSQLILTNIAIFIGGGALCYYLALRTLKPIEEAHEAQSRFTADASHELRTPITAMRTENEVALMNPKLTLKEAKEQLQSNVEELEKLTTLSEGLLRLAQIDDNHLEKTAVDPRHVVEAAIERITPHAEQKHTILTSSIKTEAKALGDTLGLTEALVTLVDNAVKYSPENAKVTVNVLSDPRSVIFTVTDNGPGISSEELPHIFDRFYRADSSRTKQHGEGYGLGLAIAKSIADAHKGELSATSKVGKGSTFSLAVPLATE